MPLWFCLAWVCGARSKAEKPVIIVSPANSIRTKRPSLKLGTWNVRTMLSGISDDLRSINDLRKTAVINNELSRLNVDIVALQETRLAEAASLREKDYTFYWHGKPKDEKREHGVGFAVKNSLLKMIEPPSNGSERILTMRLNTSSCPVTLISVYAPTLMASSDTKDEFYENLCATLLKVPSSDQVVLLGDFNARVGCDYEAWPICLGRFNVGKVNENGQRLLELCTRFSLCVANSFFDTKPQHKVSWRHPRSKHWHQLDLVLVRRSNLNTVKVVRSYHSADCDTDHLLVCCRMKLSPKKFFLSKAKGKPRLNTANMQDPVLVSQFTDLFEKEYAPETDGSDSAEKRWQSLKTAMHSCALATFGKKNTKSSDWFEAKSKELDPIISNKRQKQCEYNKHPSHQNLCKLRQARKEAKQMVRRCANDYWVELSQRIENASATGNIRAMYEGIKTATGPTQSKSAPLKSSSGELIVDKGKQMERWKEHYSDLYSRQSTVSESALAAMEQLSILHELDEVPTISDLKKAIDQLAPGKAPGSDEIPPDLIKQCQTVLLKPIYDLLCCCWAEGGVPQDMRDTKIVTLYKNKGERSDCNNYRGISLLSIVGKVYARVLLVRLQKLAERVYPESQCGFRAGRSTIDMIFSLRQLQEKCREQNMPLYLAFVDLTKAFDTVSRDGLYLALSKIGCPPKLLSLIRSFHQNMKGTVQFDGNLSEPFVICNGVKQGCVLAPTLFGIFFSMLLKHAFGDVKEGIFLRTRSDGRLFNLARLKAKTKVREAMIRDMLFADDAGIATHTEEELQLLMDRLSTACKEFGLIISLPKTKILSQGSSTEPSIKIDNYELGVVEDFPYLGSNISESLSLDSEINKRIGKAAGTLSKLTERVWGNSTLTVSTKMSVYSACILSTLLYGSETWTPYARQEDRLQIFHLRSLKFILGISWEERKTNVEVLEIAGLPSIYTLLRQRRLRWLGHVHRMDDGRIPKDLLYGELEEGGRDKGRPLLRYKDVCKRDLKALDIDLSSWETIAADRDAWRLTLKRQLPKGESKWKNKVAEKRFRRKEKAMASKQPHLPTSFICLNCGRDCKARIGLLSHSRHCS